MAADKENFEWTEVDTIGSIVKMEKLRKLQKNRQEISDIMAEIQKLTAAKYQTTIGDTTVNGVELYKFAKVEEMKIRELILKERYASLHQIGELLDSAIEDVKTEIAADKVLARLKQKNFSSP